MSGEVGPPERSEWLTFSGGRMDGVNEVCFSPPGPGQCQPWHDDVHKVDEPGVMILIGLVAVVAWIWRKK